MYWRMEGFPQSVGLSSQSPWMVTEEKRELAIINKLKQISEKEDRFVNLILLDLEDAVKEGV